MEAGDEDEGEEVGNPPNPPERAELSDASEGAAASPGAGSELMRLAGGWVSNEGDRRDEGGDAPDTDDDLRVSDEDSVEEREENVELREELELTVELIVLPNGLPSSPHILDGAGSKDGEDPIDEPRDPKPSSTPYKPSPPLPLPVTSLLPSFPPATLLLKDEKRAESRVLPPLLLPDPKRDDPASPSSVKAELRSLSWFNVFKLFNVLFSPFIPPLSVLFKPLPLRPLRPLMPLRLGAFERLLLRPFVKPLRPAPVMLLIEASPLSEELLSLYSDETNSEELGLKMLSRPWDGGGKSPWCLAAAAAAAACAAAAALGSS